MQGLGEAHLRELYDEHAGPLLGYVQGLLGDDRGLAEDVVQETLLRARRQGDGLERRHARRWLFTVARNLAVDWHRARQARLPEASEAPLRALPAPDELERALLGWQLADALRGLKPALDERGVTPP